MPNLDAIKCDVDSLAEQLETVLETLEKVKEKPSAHESNNVSLRVDQKSKMQEDKILQNQKDQALEVIIEQIVCLIHKLADMHFKTEKILNDQRKNLDIIKRDRTNLNFPLAGNLHYKKAEEGIIPEEIHHCNKLLIKIENLIERAGKAYTSESGIIPFANKDLLTQYLSNRSHDNEPADLINKEPDEGILLTNNDLGTTPHLKPDSNITPYHAKPLLGAKGLKRPGDLWNKVALGLGYSELTEEKHSHDIKFPEHLLKEFKKGFDH